ncbi:YhjD/YihY/BrkB family envelope integrity protein [Terrabacter sp. NPDC080008]|uniref:DUF1269 domain-containing protein n=1 Tax=Terrabacter sp. NPDC080008 TaxID=3155176 RepID=UPI00344FC8A8
MSPETERPRARAVGPRPLLERGRELHSWAELRVEKAQAEHVSVRLVADALREDRATGGGLLAGALAFRLFLWLLPAGLVIVALLGFSNADDVRKGLGSAGLGGYAATTIATAAGQAHDGRWVLLLIGLVGLYSTSVDLAKVMWIGTSLAWHLPISRLRRQPRAAAAAAILLLTAVLCTVAVNWLRSILYPVGLLATVLVALVYGLCGWLALRLLPHPTHITAIDLLPGAALIGVGVQALHVVTVFFLAGRISSSSQLYGALGAAATLLLWAYLLARVLMGASTLNHTLLRHRDVARLPVHQPGGPSGGGMTGVHLLRTPGRLLASLRADWRELTASLGAGGRSTSGAAGSAGWTHVTMLTVCRFDGADEAEAASGRLAQLEREGAFELVDAAVVTWPSEARRPQASHVVTGSNPGALGGAFWGLLLGVIFFAPLLGLAVGAGAGALAPLDDAGIGDPFIRRVRDEVTPGTSALFLLTAEADIDRVRDAFAEYEPVVVHTTLTSEQEAALHDYFDA